MTDYQDFQQEIAGYARQIAVHMGYPESILQNGLQPLQDWVDPRTGEKKDGLISKYYHELLEEFEEANAAYLQSQSVLDNVKRLHEAADVLYYAVQKAEQSGDSGYLEDALATLENPPRRIPRELAMLACRTKFARRRAKPNSKDPEAEYADIANALALYEQEQAAQKKPGPTAISIRRLPQATGDALAEMADKLGLAVEPLARLLITNNVVEWIETGKLPEDRLKQIIHEIIDRLD